LAETLEGSSVDFLAPEIDDIVFFLIARNPVDQNQFMSVFFEFFEHPLELFLVDFFSAKKH